MIGSWGRHTAIRDISDLDMLYRLPATFRDEFVTTGGAYKALNRVRTALKNRYPKTSIRVDALVVKVEFGDFKFEVQPVFETDDGHFEYPDTYKDRWRVTKPREEIEAISELDVSTAGKARKHCRLTRAWKNKHAVPINGLLIDTLVHRYMTSQLSDGAIVPALPILIQDFFTYLSELPKQDTWYALCYAVVSSNTAVAAPHDCPAPESEIDLAIQPGPHLHQLKADPTGFRSLQTSLISPLRGRRAHFSSPLRRWGP